MPLNIQAYNKNLAGKITEYLTKFPRQKLFFSIISGIYVHSRLF